MPHYTISGRELNGNQPKQLTRFKKVPPNCDGYKLLDYHEGERNNEGKQEGGELMGRVSNWALDIDTTLQRTETATASRPIPTARTL